MRFVFHVASRSSGPGEEVRGVKHGLGRVDGVKAAVGGEEEGNVAHDPLCPASSAQPTANLTCTIVPRISSPTFRPLRSLQRLQLCHR